MGIRTCIYSPPTRRGFRGHPYKVLQGKSYHQTRGSVFSMRIVKLPASIIKAPSAAIFKTVLAEVFFHLPH